MRLFKTLALAGILAVAGAACADLEVTNLNDPDRERALSSATDVESLISGSFSTWWAAVHYSDPSSALSVGADAHSASWGNWGMQDFSSEPRQPYNNDPAYTYNNVAETPWGNLYGALAAVRDGLIALEELTIPGQNANARAQAFGKMVQGLSMAYIGILFDKGFIVDETSDLEAIDFVGYNEVHAAGIQKLNEAEQLAASTDFTIPAEWVGYDRSWSSDYMVKFIRSYRARLASQVARTAAERENLDWAKIRQDAETGLGLTDDYAGAYDGSNWPWMRQKLHTCCIAGWARIDYRTVGPADASGNYATWLAAAPDDKLPFNIDTDDSRVTGGSFDANGSRVRYIGSSPFPAARGIYHYSHYISDHWTHLSTAGNFVGRYIDFDPMETDFLVAEAAYHLNGPNETTMEIVNKYRANGGLPLFTSPTGDAPGGARCVPKNDGVNCGDLFEALKYEKRIELFHYGMATEYFDDRGWGDLVSGTPIHLPVPGSELLLLLEEIYTFGGSGDGAAPNIVTDLSPEALHTKRVAMEKYRELRRQSESMSPIAH